MGIEEVVGVGVVEVGKLHGWERISVPHDELQYAV